MLRRVHAHGLAALLLALAACGDSGGATGPAGGLATQAPAATDQAVCVWNQAYQENTEADAIARITQAATGCYVLLDPYESAAARDAIGTLKAANNTVGCYISVGTCEAWRDDFDAIKTGCVDTQWSEWEGEYFVDQASDALVAGMEARIDQLAAWGCDLVEFDNMDWAFDDDHRASYGFDITPDQAIAYFQSLCDHVHVAGMGCMAKNTRRGAEGFDGGTFESWRDTGPGTFDWWETADLAGFLAAGQLGVIVHYDESDCDAAYAEYRRRYGGGVSFVCEDPSAGGYVHD